MSSMLKRRNNSAQITSSIKTTQSIEKSKIAHSKFGWRFYLFLITLWIIIILNAHLYSKGKIKQVYSGVYYMFFPRPKVNMTADELSKYNGEDPTKPIYLAIKGRIYDVTAGRQYYGPKGGYHFFAGRDASRAFVTGCFDKKECLIDYTDDFDERQKKDLDDWVQFYEKSDKYFHIGYLVKEKDPKPSKEILEYEKRNLNT